jgi:hypothetical protein
VSELGAYGVRATPSYSLFPQGPVPPDQAAVRAALQKGGYDGALISTLKDVKRHVYVEPAGWADGFKEIGGVWTTGPAAVETSESVTVETTLWNPNNAELVWSTVTQTESPTSNKHFVSSLTGTVVPSLYQGGLIPPKQGRPVSLAH